MSLYLNIYRNIYKQPETKYTPRKIRNKSESTTSVSTIDTRKIFIFGACTKPNTVLYNPKLVGYRIHCVYTLSVLACMHKKDDRYFVVCAGYIQYYQFDSGIQIDNIWVSKPNESRKKKQQTNAHTTSRCVWMNQILGPH